MSWLNSLRPDSGSPQPPREAVESQPADGPRSGLKRLIANLVDADPQVRLSAARMLDQAADPAYLDHFLALLEDENFQVRLTAIQYLRRISDPAVAPALVARLADQDNDVRQSAAQALGSLRHRPALEPLVLALADPEPAVRHAAAAALEDIDPRWVRTDAAQRAIPQLVELCAAPQPWIAAAAEQVLEKLRGAKDSSTETWKRESGIRNL